MLSESVSVDCLSSWLWVTFFCFFPVSQKSLLNTGYYRWYIVKTLDYVIFLWRILIFALAGKRLASHFEFVETWSDIWLGQIYFSFAWSPQANPFVLALVFTPEVWLFWGNKQPEMLQSLWCWGSNSEFCLQYRQWPVADIPALTLQPYSCCFSLSSLEVPLHTQEHRLGVWGNFICQLSG